MPEEEQHPIKALATEAEEITRDMATFFDPIEKYFGPHEEEDWPRDLTPGELAGLIPQLRRTIGSLSKTIGLIVTENQADPDKAKLVTQGLRLIEQGEDTIQAGETLFGTPAGQPATRTQPELAAENFPGEPAAAPQADRGTEDSSGQGPDTAARRRPGESPGTPGSTPGTSPQSGGRA